MKSPSIETNTLVIGASAAGLAVSACLQREGIPYITLEQSEATGFSWRNHYDRLYLNTHKQYSALPFFPMPRNYPKYISRQQFIEYLEQYSRYFRIQPIFKQRVLSAKHQANRWLVQTQNTEYKSRNLVVATGKARKPLIPHWKTKNLFQGTTLHSSEYKNGIPFRGQTVLVVGFGNSGADIALDLLESDCSVAISVRSSNNIVSREFLGISSQIIAILLSKFPPEIADALTVPLANALNGDMSPYGLKKTSHGPVTHYIRNHRAPVVNTGIVKLIKQGKIKIYPNIKKFTKTEVVFEGGESVKFDSIVFATGYCSDIESFLEHAEKVINEKGYVKQSGYETDLPGLYFCGFRSVPSGTLREIAIESRRISKDISKKPKEVTGSV